MAKKECGNCSCKKIEPSYHNCTALQDANDEQILCALNSIQTTEDYTSLPKKMAGVLYQFWCLFKNIIAQICFLMNELRRLCRTLACLNKRIDDLQASIVRAMLGNVQFSLSSRTGGGGTSSGGTTYMKSSVDQQNRTFKFVWNMIAEAEVGIGEINGRVDADYTANNDGTITVDIKSYTITNISYQAKRAGSSVANISISKLDGTKIVNQTYNPYSSWSLAVNKTVSVGKVVTLQPKGSTGDVALFTTLDTWLYNPTNGTAYAKYDNNNSKIPDFTSPCPIDCQQ